MTVYTREDCDAVLSSKRYKRADFENVHSAGFTKAYNDVMQCPVLNFGERELLSYIIADLDYKKSVPEWQHFAKKCNVTKSTIYRRAKSLQNKNLLDGWKPIFDSYESLFVKKDYSVIELREERNLFNYQDKKPAQKPRKKIIDINSLRKQEYSTQNAIDGTETSPADAKPLNNINYINNKQENITSLRSEKKSEEKRSEVSLKIQKKNSRKEVQFSKEFNRFFAFMVAMFIKFAECFPVKVRAAENFDLFKQGIHGLWLENKKFRNPMLWFGILSYLVSSETDKWKNGDFTFGFGYLLYAFKHRKKAKYYVLSKYCDSFSEFFELATRKTGNHRELDPEKILFEPQDWRHNCN